MKHEEVQVRGCRFAAECDHFGTQLQIHAAADVLRYAFDLLCEKVGADTGLPVFVGAAPAPVK